MIKTKENAQQAQELSEQLRMGTGDSWHNAAAS
jgi:hypothetical protein